MNEKLLEEQPIVENDDDDYVEIEYQMYERKLNGILALKHTMILNMVIYNMHTYNSKSFSCILDQINSTSTNRLSMNNINNQTQLMYTDIFLDEANSIYNTTSSYFLANMNLIKITDVDIEAFVGFENVGFELLFQKEPFQLINMNTVYTSVDLLNYYTYKLSYYLVLISIYYTIYFMVILTNSIYQKKCKLLIKNILLSVVGISYIIVVGNLITEDHFICKATIEQYKSIEIIAFIKLVAVDLLYLMIYYIVSQPFDV